MPTIKNWLGGLGKANAWLNDIEEDARAVHYTHHVISQKSVSIVVYRGDTTLSAQTVRIEQTRIQPDKDLGPIGRESNANAVLIGYKGHPTIADCDLQAGDRFQVNGINFEVRLIFPETPGRLEAWLEVNQ